MEKKSKTSKNIVHGSFKDASYFFNINNNIHKLFDRDLNEEILKLKKVQFCKRITKVLHQDQGQVDNIMEQAVFYIAPVLESLDENSGIVFTVPVKFGEYPKEYYEEYLQYCIWLNGYRVFLGIIIKGDRLSQIINTLDDSFWYADTISYLKDTPIVKTRASQVLLDWEFKVSENFYDDVLEQDFFIQSIRHIHTRTLYYVQREIDLLVEYTENVPD